jgi:hypothetical protein
MNAAGDPQAVSTDDLAGRSSEREQDRDAPVTPYPDDRGGADAARSDRMHDDAGAGAQQERQDDGAGGETGAPLQGAPLLDDATADPFAQRWNDVQARFVDDPRQAVSEADSLVAELMQTLAERFSTHKSGLEEQWNRGDEPDTESLRLALQQYRSFFDRLLST